MKKVLLLIRKENSSFSNEMYIKAIEKFGGSPVLINDDISEDECLKVLKDVQFEAIKRKIKSDIIEEEGE